MVIRKLGSMEGRKQKPVTWRISRTNKEVHCHVAPDSSKITTTPLPCPDSNIYSFKISSMAE